MTTLGTRGPRRGRAGRPVASHTSGTRSVADRGATERRTTGSRTARDRGANGRRRAVPALRDARSSRRLRTALALYLVITLALGWRLVDIQVLSAPAYREMARRQTERDLELPAERGKVYDRTGEPPALSLPTATIVANPRQIADAGDKVDVAGIARL